MLYPHMYAFSGEILKEVIGVYENVVARSESNKIWVWGSNVTALLGNKADGDQIFPILMYNGEGNPGIKKLRCRWESCVFVNERGDIFRWGSNQHGALATGDRNPLYFPTYFRQNGDFIDISSYVFVFSTNNSVYTAGENTRYQLGQVDGKQSDFQYTPKKVSLLPEGREVTGVFSSTNAVFVRYSDNTVYGWGYAKRLFLCTNVSMIYDPQVVPVEIPFMKYIGADGFVEEISCFDACFILVRRGKTNFTQVYSWGSQYEFSLGREIVDDNWMYPVEVKVPLASGDFVKKISAGFGNYMMLTSSGKLYGYGMNNNFEFETEVPFHGQVKRPLLIPTLEEVTYISDSRWGTTCHLS